MKKKILALFVSVMLIGTVVIGWNKDKKNNNTPNKVEDKADNTDNKDESNKTGNDSTKEVKDNSLIVKNEFPLPIGENAVETGPDGKMDEKTQKAIEKEVDKIKTLGDKFIEIMFNSTPETLEDNLKKIEPFSSKEFIEDFPSVKDDFGSASLKLISIESRSTRFNTISLKKDQSKTYESAILTANINYEDGGQAEKGEVKIYFIVNPDTKAYEILNFAVK